MKCNTNGKFKTSMIYQGYAETWFTGFVNSLSADLTKWPNTLKQFVGKLPTNCLSVFGHFMGLALKGLKDRKEIFKMMI